MKVEITNEGEHFNIYPEKQTYPLQNMRARNNRYAFYDDDILNLLGTKYSQFEKGKYEFEVSKSHLQLITGERGAKNRKELEMYND